MGFAADKVCWPKVVAQAKHTLLYKCPPNTQHFRVNNISAGEQGIHIAFEVNTEKLSEVRGKGVMIGSKRTNERQREKR
jgi:hypothetical protein